LHGLMADMEKILSIAENANIVVIEDAAQAHGAEYKGRRAGTLGLAGCYSFYPGKNLGAYGEAGAVVTNDDGIANKIRMYRDWGQEEKYSHVLKGFNYRMDGIQGAVLDVKLKYIEKWTETRRRVAEAYTSVFKDYEITTPDAPPEFRHVYHVYAVLAANREKTISYLSDQGIGTNIHYSAAVHLQPAYVDLGYTEGDFPISEWLGRSFISLPMFPELTPEQIRYVCNQVILALEPAQFIEATFC